MKLRIVDHLNSEDVAMLQALYSRSAESVDEHLKRVQIAGSGKFMSTYYVNYGHKSIADCGSTTLFIEGVSLLAAKAIQDWPLYSGQETSTRYIDMSKQAISDPIDSPMSKLILSDWMHFYTSKQERTLEHVRAQHPRREDEKEESYDRACKARTFDILRGFLPAGIATQLSWHTNLRQAGDHLAWLVQHPMDEVRTIAREMRSLLGVKYPSSGGGLSLPLVAGVRSNEWTNERLSWMAEAASEWTYSVSTKDQLLSLRPWEEFDITIPAEYERLLASRPRGCALPHFMTDFGQAHLEFALDFGSFRDLQRHRNGVVRMPLLDTYWDFEPWYLEQLDPDSRGEATHLIGVQKARILECAGTVVEKQYLTALGFRVPCSVTMALPSLIYFLEMRSQKTVHPTLRACVLEAAKMFKIDYPRVALHVDFDPDDWTVRRGEQTITERA
jgi:thymidylate synthase ThyX